MKRFYCTVCKRIKRVRTLPSNIKSQHSDTVTNRVGTCNRHSASLSAKIAYLHNLGVK